MKSWPFAVAGLMFLALAGCRTDPSITLLERQNRMLEDEVYRLRGILQDGEEGVPPGCAVTDSIEAAPSPTEIRESTSAPIEPYLPQRRRSPSRQTVSPPKVELPGEAQPPGEIPDTLKRPAGTKAPAEPGKLQLPGTPKQWQESSGPNLPGPKGTERNGSGKTNKIRPASALEPIAKADSKDVGQLVLNRMLTGGYSSHDTSGDCGVLVVLEPRDQKGRRLEAPGDVVVVLLDPAKKGDDARLGRWDFPAAETAKLFRGNGIARGMYIQCPWLENPPVNNHLHLFVRYTTRDDRKLEVDQTIEVALPGERISRWTPTEIQQTSAQEDGHSCPSVDRQECLSSSDSKTRAESIATDSSDDDNPRAQSADSPRTASGNYSAKIKRPVWSPERY